MDWWPGQSGSPIWSRHVNDQSNVPKLIGIVSRQAEDGGNVDNIGLKINDSIQYDLAIQMMFTPVPGRGIIGGDVDVNAPPALADLTGLDGWFNTAFDTISSSSARPGDELAIEIGIQNNGVIAAGNVSVSFYLSRDELLSTEDTMLGDVVVPHIEPYGSSVASLAATVPLIESGEYFVGWKIDSLEQFVEYDELDNVGAFPGLFSVFPPGDYDLDGDVDDDDYAVYRGQFGSSGPFADGTPNADGNRDGVVDAADYALWRRYHGQGVSDGGSSDAALIPEPTGWTQLMLGLSLWVAAVWRNAGRKYQK